MGKLLCMHKFKGKRKKSLHVKTSALTFHHKLFCISQLSLPLGHLVETTNTLQTNYAKQSRHSSAVLLKEMFCLGGLLSINIFM